MGPRQRRVIWTEGAVLALDEAIAFIAADSPANARALLDRILEAAESLSTLPDRGISVPEVAEPGVRQLFPGSYRLIYRVDQDQVTVLAMLHQREDIGRWSPRGRY